MTVTKQLIDNINKIKTTLNEISVYNLDVKTSLELYYELAKKVNEVINELSRFEGIVSDEVVDQNKKLIYLLGEGLKEQVGLKIYELISNGTMDSIINHKIFNDLINKIETYKQQTDEQFNSFNSKRKYYYLSEFGGVGDGVTDNTECFKQAIFNLKDNDTLLIEKGVFIISDSITLDKPINIKGCGSESIIKFNTNDSSYHKSMIINNTTSYNELTHLKLDESRYERNGLDYQDFGAIRTCSNTLIDCVEITNTFGPGIGNYGTGSFENVTISNCFIHGTAHHCIYFGGDYINNIKIVNNKLKTNKWFVGRRYDSNIIKFRFKKSNVVYSNIEISDNVIDKPTTINGKGISIYISNQGDNGNTNQDNMFNNFTLSNNIFNEENTPSAYNVFRIEGRLTSDNILVNKNIINNDNNEKTTVFGFSYAVGNNIVICDNIIKKCYDGIICKNATVKDNIINYTCNGIVSTDSNISNNIITKLSDVDEVGYSIDNINSNVNYNIINVGSFESTAIRVGTCNNKHICNNNINNAKYGLSKSFESNTNITNCIINGNLFENISSLEYRNIIDNTSLDIDNIIEYSIKDKYSSTVNRIDGKYISQRFYDRTLKKPLWWDGSNWRDATGSVV